MHANSSSLPGYLSRTRITMISYKKLSGTCVGQACTTNSMETSSKQESVPRPLVLMQRLVRRHSADRFPLIVEAHVKAKAIADVLYSNPQFRALLHDGSILARDLLSDVVEATATAIAPEESDLIELEEEAADVDGRTIKDDVEQTKKQLDSKVETAKTQVKQTYDQATTTAIETLTTLQEQGQRFGAEVQSQASHAASSAVATADSLAKAGSQKAKELSASAQETINQALAKVEEVTGITQDDIKKRLDEGISIEDLLNEAQAAGSKAKKYAGNRLRETDQAAGKVLTNTKKSVNNFAEDQNLRGKANEVIGKGQEASDQALETAKDVSSQAEDVASAAVKDAQSTAGEAKEKTEFKVQDAKGATETALDDTTSRADKAAESASQTGKKSSNDSGLGSQSKNNTGKSSHLKAIGIVHGDAPENTLPSTSRGQLDPQYTFDEDKSVDAGTQTSTHQKSNQTSSDASALAQEVIAQIKSRVKDVQGISEEDVEAAANDLIEKTSQVTNSAANNVKDAAHQADQISAQYLNEADESAAKLKKDASEVADKAGNKATEFVDQASKTGKDVASAAQDKGAELADTVKDQSAEAADKIEDAKDAAATQGQSVLDSTQSQMSAAKEQIQNIDQEDLQKAVNDLLRTTKRKLEQATGVKAEDARQSLDWAIKRGEELADQAMKSSREGVQIAKNKSSEAGKVISEKSAEAGTIVQKAAVSAGAQTKHALQNAPRGAAGQIHETLDASQEFMDTAVTAVKESTVEIREYLSKKFPQKRRDAIRKHFQGLAVALRDNTDYSNGLDGLISIAKKYIDYTLTFTEELPSDASDAISTNAELDRAVSSTLKLIERFSNGVGFSRVQKSYGKLKKDMQKEKGSDDFLHDCMMYFKKIVQDLKYAASEDAERHGQQLLQRVDDFSEDTGFKQHTNELIQELVRLAEGFASDKALFNFIQRGQTLFKHLVMNEYGNFVFKKRVMKDFFNIIMPSMLKLVQYIPISRIEFQNADVDVLIENLVFESSSNHDQSFLPYRLQIDNHNTVEFLNAYKFESDYSNQVTVKIQGLTMAVRDAGFYIRKKTGFWRFVDSGLLDLVMDGKGIDIDIDLQMSTDDEDEDVTKDALFIVKDVRVNIHKLDFSTSGTKHGWLVGLVKPFIRGFVKRQVGLAVGAAMKEQLEYYEYQLRMLQHRIKTAYIANNGQASFESFFRAVFTANAGNNAGRKGQFEVSVGKPGPLAGIFTKASLQQEVEESDAIAAEHGRSHSWRNDIFDLGV